MNIKFKINYSYKIYQSNFACKIRRINNTTFALFGKQLYAKIIPVIRYENRNQFSNNKLKQTPEQSCKNNKL